MPHRRRRPPIPVILVLLAEPPTQDETCPERSRRIDAVLMTTDSIIGQAGRSGVVLIPSTALRTGLKGSRSQKALDWEWDKLPHYGRLQHLTAEQIARKVDWCIHHRWLRIEYDRHIPLLFHTESGPGFPTRYAPCARPLTILYRPRASSPWLILNEKAIAYDHSQLHPPADRRPPGSN